MKATTQTTKSMISEGSKVMIPAGTRILENGTQTKLDLPRTITVSKVEYTKAGNAKIHWRGHRGMKSAILK